MDYRQLIVFNIESLIKKYKKTERFKANAYTKALAQIPNTPITSINDIIGIGGEKTQQKIKIIIQTNKNLDEVEEYINNSQYKIIEDLQKIHGVGPIKAHDLLQNNNIMSISHLRENLNLLNNIQKIGLYHFDDIQKKIPHKEMLKHDIYLQTKLNDIIFTIAGSYRRKTLNSGDIDILITGDKNRLNDVVQILQNTFYIHKEAVFAKGDVKFMGLCKLPRHKIYRRIDILYTPPHEYPFALLYFTGNFKFNVDMRKHALQKGFSLNEQGLINIKTKTPVDHIFENEKDIFVYLEFPYVDPEARII